MLVGLTVGLAGVGLARAPAKSDHTDRAVSAQDVRAIFLRDCAVCHGADGRGTEQGPSLFHAGAAVVDFWLSTGRMPLPSAGAEAVRRTPKYPPAVIHALVAYVAKLVIEGRRPFE